MRWQWLLRDELAGEILSGQEIVPVQIQKPGEEAIVSKANLTCGTDEARIPCICIKRVKLAFICQQMYQWNIWSA